jgi:hypothetical protein
LRGKRSAFDADQALIALLHARQQYSTAAAGSSESDLPRHAKYSAQRRRKALFAAAPTLAVPAVSFRKSPPAAQVNNTELAVTDIGSTPMPNTWRRVFTEFSPRHNNV